MLRKPAGARNRPRLVAMAKSKWRHEPSAGPPTSADSPHPRREGFDNRRLRTMGHRDEIKSVTGQGERMRLHEQPTPQFIADDHVAADRNPLSADNGVNRVQLLAETQVPDPFEGSEIGIERAAPPPAIAARSALPDRGLSNHSGSKEDARDRNEGAPERLCHCGV